MLLKNLGKIISNLSTKSNIVPSISCKGLSTVNIGNYNLAIPPDIQHSLWFTNGPLKNYSKETMQKNYKKDGFAFTFTFGSSEPSSIDINLPIEAPNTNNVEPLSYFPSYEELNPQQRWIYLKWLSNIDNPIDIGYVFILYYGLERHLFFGDFESAYHIIVRLRKNHSNPSFLNYSGNAIVAASIMQNRADFFLEYVNDIENTDRNPINDLYLFAKNLLKMELYKSEILAIATSVGFNNMRYIKNNTELFLMKMQEQLKKLYGNDCFPLPKYNLKNIPTARILIIANYSMSDNDRNITIPSFLSDSLFKEEMNRILKSTHDAVKTELAQNKKVSKKYNQIGTNQEQKTTEYYESDENYVSLSFKAEIERIGIDIEQKEDLRNYKVPNKQDYSEMIAKCLARDPEYRNERYEFFQTFFELSNGILDSNTLDEQFAHGNEALKMLKQAVTYFREDGPLPPRIYCRDYLPELYMQYGRWEEAEKVIRVCVESNAYGYEAIIDGTKIWVPEDGSMQMNHLKNFHNTADMVIEYIIHNPGCLQKDMYKNLSSVDRNILIKFLRISKMITKEPYGKTYKLYTNETQ